MYKLLRFCNNLRVRIISFIVDRINILFSDILSCLCSSGIGKTRHSLRCTNSANFIYQLPDFFTPSMSVSESFIRRLHYTLFLLRPLYSFYFPSGPPINSGYFYVKQSVWSQIQSNELSKEYKGNKSIRLICGIGAASAKSQIMAPSQREKLVTYKYNVIQR